MNFRLRPALFLLTLAPSLPLPAQTTAVPPVAPPPAVIKLGLGFDYSRGDYGYSQQTEVISVPANLSYEPDRWAFRASIPFIGIKGPASVIAGSAPVAAPGRPTRQYESGLGDVTASATYHARPVPGELNVDLTGRVKFPTADEDRGLGTGETDYYAQVDLYQSFDVITPFLSLGYRFMGHSAAYPLKDGFYTTVGVSYRTTDGAVLGLAYDWRAKIIDGAPDASDALAFASLNLNDRWNALGYLLVGFNNASPDYGLGGALTYKF